MKILFCRWNTHRDVIKRNFMEKERKKSNELNKFLIQKYLTYLILIFIQFNNIKYYLWKHIRIKDHTKYAHVMENENKTYFILFTFDLK